MEKVADGVWLLRGDLREAMNIYFLEDEGGVVQFDAGTKAMRKAARAAGEQLGGVKRVVLGHAHADHRGTAPYYGGAGLLPSRRSGRRRRGRGDRPLYGPVAAAGGAGALDLPLPAASLGRRGGEDRRHGGRGRGGGRLPRHPLSRPRAGADRAVAGERPGGAGQRRRLLRRLGAAGKRCPRARQAFPIPPGPGTTNRRRSRCASWRRWSRRWSAPATRSPCAGRT